jgi:hypothetical protein
VRIRLAALAVICATAAVTAERQPAAPRVPVVVELFTSEGCSSCPPADVVLSRLVKEQPVDGVEVIALGMHVTYWDQLGWKDPASLQSATDRQQSYGHRFGEDRVYTPQAVIDGRVELVASDESGVRRAIARAAQTPHAKLTFTASVDGDAVVTTLAVTERPPSVKEPLDVVFFVTEDDLSTVVKRGENGGHTLHHDAVVRQERYWEPPPGTEPVHISIHGLKPEWKRDRLKAVVVLYGRKSHEIVGAAASRLK